MIGSSSRNDELSFHSSSDCSIAHPVYLHDASPTGVSASSSFYRERSSAAFATARSTASTPKASPPAKRGVRFHEDPRAAAAGKGEAGGGWMGVMRESAARGRDHVVQQWTEWVDPQAGVGEASSDDDRRRPPAIAPARGAGRKPRTRDGAARSEAHFNSMFQSAPQPLRYDHGEDYRSASQHVGPSGGRPPLVRMEMQRSNPDGRTGPMPLIHFVDEDAMSDDLANSDVDASDEDGTELEVDLLGALEGYRANPNDCFGHLVAAALSTRSPSHPVTGEEVKAANRTPFLVKLIANSQHLDVNDPIAHEEVQATVDEVIPTDNADLNPEVYEYLKAFFSLPFVRISPQQYRLLCHSGFEYIGLLHDHRHVIPHNVSSHSLALIFSTTIHLVSIIIMIFHLLSILFCTVSIALVVRYWMSKPNCESYGLNTLITYGAGFAANIIFIMFSSSRKPDESMVEPNDDIPLPSSYATSVPLIPVFDVWCMVVYIRALRRNRYILAHNALVLSRLSGVGYAISFGVPQLLVQCFYNYTSNEVPPQYQKDSTFRMLIGAVLIHWAISVLRFAWMSVAYDSVSGLGFACFDIRTKIMPLYRTNRLVYLCHYLMFFVGECCAFLVCASAIVLEEVGESCKFLPITVIAEAGLALTYMAVLFTLLLFTDAPILPVSYASIVVALLQVAILITGSIAYREDSCSTYETRVMQDAFFFGFCTWATYWFFMALWILLTVLWLLWGVKTRVLSSVTRPLQDGVSRASNNCPDAQSDSPSKLALATEPTSSAPVP